jgi:imidazole glycerol-phosphate synthase subunit HisH
VKTTVTVVDYGVGNLLSVARALEHCGAQVQLAETPAQVRDARLLVLPGVGAFADGMNELRRRELDQPVIEFARSGRPLLGICLGMQMLLEASEEFGEHAGLGIVPGRVRAIPATTSDGRPHKIPHIGWTPLLRPAAWEGTVLEGIAPGSEAYFVHTFTAVPAAQQHRLADADYDGRLVCAALRHGAVFGCQFHPEKSADTGLKVLANFINMEHRAAL